MSDFGFDKNEEEPVEHSKQELDDSILLFNDPIPQDVSSEATPELDIDEGIRRAQEAILNGTKLRLKDPRYEIHSGVWNFDGKKHRSKIGHDPVEGVTTIN